MVESYGRVHAAVSSILRSVALAPVLLGQLRAGERVAGSFEEAAPNVGRTCLRRRNKLWLCPRVSIPPYRVSTDSRRRAEGTPATRSRRPAEVRRSHIAVFLPLLVVVCFCGGGCVTHTTIAVRIWENDRPS